MPWHARLWPCVNSGWPAAKDFVPSAKLVLGRVSKFCIASQKSRLISRRQITDHSLYGWGADNAFSVLSITHEAANNLGAEAARILQASELEQGSYRNRFDAAPASARIAPLPLHKPTAPGLQTAQVVAAQGEPLSLSLIHI